MLTSTLQLAVRGKPSAFDINCDNDMCVVASPGCLTFFHLAGLGSPRHVIHYEQPQQIRQLRYQKNGFLAALRGGVISLWDPSKSLRPLIGFIQSSGWITDLNFHPTNCNILATSSDTAGGVSLWDIRSPAYSTMQMLSGQVATSVDWCPSNTNLLAACSDAQNVYIWDIRMVGSNSTVATLNGSKNESYTTINSKSPAGRIFQCCWCGGEERKAVVPTSSFSSSIIPSIMIGRYNGSVEWWDVNAVSGLSMTSSTSTITSTRSSDISIDNNPLINTNCTASPSSEFIDSSSIMLATPYGRGVIICKTLDNKVSEKNDVTHLSNKEKKVSNLKISVPFDPISNYANTNIDSNSNHGFSSDITSRLKMEISLLGYPREGLSLEKAFLPPSQENEKMFKGNSTSLIATSCEPVLGVRWGTPGRLLPSTCGSLELLAITDSAALHIIRIPIETVEHSLLKEKEREESSVNSSTLKNENNLKRYTSSRIDNEDDVSHCNKVTVGNMQPIYSLKRFSTIINSQYESQLSNQDLRQGHSQGQGQWYGHRQIDVNQKGNYINKSMVPFRSEFEGGEASQSANVTLNSTTGLGLKHDSDPSKMEFYLLLQKEVLELEEGLQRGILECLSISRVDQYARQVTLEVKQACTCLYALIICCLYECFKMNKTLFTALFFSLSLSLSLSLIFHPHSLPLSSLPFSLLMSTSLSFYTKIPFIKHLLHSPLMKALVDGLLRARKLRSQIEIYQHYRKMGIRTLDQARQYEGLSLCNR